MILKVCRDGRKCFARDENHRCTILSKTYPDGQCPFCKPKRNITNGILYPDVPENDEN